MGAIKERKKAVKEFRALEEALTEAADLTHKVGDLFEEHVEDGNIPQKELDAILNPFTAKLKIIAAFMQANGQGGKQ